MATGERMDGAGGRLAGLLPLGLDHVFHRAFCQSFPAHARPMIPTQMP